MTIKDGTHQQQNCGWQPLPVVPSQLHLILNGSHQTHCGPSGYRTSTANTPSHQTSTSASSYTLYGCCADKLKVDVSHRLSHAADVLSVIAQLPSCRKCCEAGMLQLWKLTNPCGDAFGTALHSFNLPAFPRTTRPCIRDSSQQMQETAMGMRGDVRQRTV